MQDSPNRAAIKKEKGGKNPGSLFQQLMPLWLLIGCLSWQPAGDRNKSHWPQCTCQEQERDESIPRIRRGTLGWVEKESGGGGMFLSSLGASGEEEVLCGTSKTQQTNKEVDLFYYLLKAPWSYAIIQLRQSRAPRGLGCKGHVRNSAARFLRIFPPAPCFFLMASGVHWKGRREGKKLSFQDRQFASKVGHEITTFMALWVNSQSVPHACNMSTEERPPSPSSPSPYQHFWRIKQKHPADSERE